MPQASSAPLLEAVEQEARRLFGPNAGSPLVFSDLASVPAVGQLLVWNAESRRFYPVLIRPAEDENGLIARVMRGLPIRSRLDLEEALGFWPSFFHGSRIKVPFLGERGFGLQVTIGGREAMIAAGHLLLPSRRASGVWHLVKPVPAPTESGFSPQPIEAVDIRTKTDLSESLYRWEQSLLPSSAR